MQTLRGEIYLADGAIESRQLTADGRHCQEADDHGWHLLTMSASGRVSGCLRYLSHGNTTAFENLTVRHSALASADQWAGKLRAAVESELELARRRGAAYVEVGGWAIAEERRATADALRVALATFGMARLLGGGLGITTATTRHCSSSILRKIGGRSLNYEGELPPYYDPQYKCQMEILRFDSSRPDPRYNAWIEQLQTMLEEAPVICRTRRQPATAEASESTFVPHIPRIPVWVPATEAL